MIVEAFLIVGGLFASSILAVVLWVAYLHRQYAHIPGPKRESFFMGMIPSIAKNGTFVELMHQWSEEYGPVACVWLGIEPFVVLSDAELVKDVFVTKDLPKASKIYSMIKYMFNERSMGEGLVTVLDKDRWKKRRTMINPAFHRSYLKLLVPNFNRSTELLMAKLHRLADGETVVDLMKEFHKTALDVIAKAAFGLNLNTIEDADEQFTKAADTILGGIKFKINNPLHKVDFRTYDTQKAMDADVRLIRKHGEQCVGERRKMIAEGKELPKDIMSMIVEKAALDPSVTDEELVDEFVTFIIAGQETTANMLSFFMLLLLKDPMLTQRLTSEIFEVLGDRKDVRFEDLAKFKFMGQCIKETLRLYPPAAGVDRMTPHAMKYGGYEIPKGTIILNHIFSIQRDPKYWPNPKTFNPDRWDSESAQNPGIVNAFMPFSAGPRNCIGRYFAEFEAKVILARLFQEFVVTLMPGSQIEIGQMGTLRPKDGVPVTLTQRNKSTGQQAERRL